VNARTIAMGLLALATLQFVPCACLSQTDLDKPPPGAPKEEAPHLAVRRMKGEKKSIAREWTVLVTPGHGEVKHGKDQGWYSSGAKEWERAFDHGKPKGTWRRWYENGQLESETEFAGADVERPMRFWHANGQLSAEGMAKDGSRCGTWKFWNEDGTLREQGEYAGSLREGAWTIWSQDGSPPQTLRYQRGTILEGS
jgi:hypothetical protein